jgi:hypothetical protein
MDGRVDSCARLIRWRVDGKFDSVSTCEYMREVLGRITILARRAEDPPMELEIAADHQAICIPSDDLRLNGD